MNTNKVKTSKKSVTVNTINAKQFYFIIDQLIFCTDKNANNEFIPGYSKETLSNVFNIDKIKNIIIPGAMLEQIELYLKDNFKIDNIEKVVFWNREYKDYNHKLSQDEIRTYDLNDTYYLRISDIKHEYYKPIVIDKLQITLSNSTGSRANLEYVYHDLTAAVLPVINTNFNADLAKEYILSSNDLDKIKTALKCVSKDALRQVLCNVAIQQNNIVTTDGGILYFDKLSFELEADIILSASDLSQFFKSNKNTMEATLKICGGFCSINNFEINLIPGNYPAWQAIVPNNYSSLITIKKSDFPLKVKSGINPLTKLITFDNSGLHGKDRTTASTLDYCFETNCKQEFSFGLNYKKAVSIIKELKTDNIEIKYISNTKPIMINDNFVIMVIKTDLSEIVIENSVEVMSPAKEIVRPVIGCVAMIKQPKPIVNKKEQIQDIRKKSIIDKAMQEKYRVNDVVYTLSELLQKFTWKIESGETTKYEYSRHKFNNMNYEEQAEYSKKLQEMKKTYRLYIDNKESGYDILKSVYDYLSALPVPNAIANMPLEVKSEVCSENLEQKSNIDFKAVKWNNDFIVYPISGIAKDYIFNLNSVNRKSKVLTFAKFESIAKEFIIDLQEPIKPTQNLLPVHIPTTQDKPFKTALKTIHKPINQIEYKQVLSLPIPNNIVKTINCNDYKVVKSQSIPVAAEQIELADYTEMPTEGDLGNHGGLDNFYELYSARLKEKRAIRKAKNNFAGKFNQVLSFSSVAIMLFVFIHTFLSVQSSNNTFDLLAGNQIKQEQVKSTTNLADLADAGTIQQDSKEPPKNTPFDALNLISLVLCIGKINRNRYLLIEDINNGIKINDIFTKFMYVRTEKEHNKVMEIAYKAMFGTYKNVSIIDFLINCEHKRITNEIIYNDFISAIKRWSDKHGI